MSTDEQYTIDTPENIEFRYDVAGIGSRFLAAILDTLLLTTVLVVLSLFMSLLIEPVEDVAGDAGASVLAAVWIILIFLFLWGYYLFFELVWNGQSPGKRSVRLRVVREGGRPVTFAASAIRNLVRVIDFLPGFYGIGVLTMFIDRRARRLGDLTGGTIVVKERRAVSLESLTARATPLPQVPASQLPAAADLLPNIHTLSSNDYDLVQEFLRRRSELGAASRQRLGLRLAEQIGARLATMPEPQRHEPFLERVAHDYRLSRQLDEATRRGDPQPDSSASV
jgi:uncharacterized RDD family membrane protein YckC